ncbi:MAG: IS256 family transposase [Anaerolineae bacterium]
MQRVKPLDELTPADLWREVPESEDEFWRDTRERQLRLLKGLLEGALEEELTVLLGAGRYRRVEGRHGYRNGFYQRDLATQVGIVTAIRVPRARDRVGEPSRARRSVFSRYQRRQAQVNQVIRETFLAGVSTRRVGETLEALLGERVSAQTVSRVTRSLDREVERFHDRAISDDVRYLLLDGVYLRVKGAHTARRKLVLCAYGITVTGERRLLDFRLATTESQAQWEAFLSSLRERGLLGRLLKLIVSDGCKGLHAALDTVYPYVPRQHCWVHKLRNVAAHLKRSQQEECMAGARTIYQSQTRRAAVQAYWNWARRWRGEAPRAVACLERDLEPLLSFLASPTSHRRMVRTTNAIERCFREVRRRTRPMSCFNNAASCERIIYAVFSHLNRNWQGNPLPQFTHNS